MASGGTAPCSQVSMPVRVATATGRSRCCFPEGLLTPQGPADESWGRGGAGMPARGSACCCSSLRPCSSLSCSCSAAPLSGHAPLSAAPRSAALAQLSGSAKSGDLGGRAGCGRRRRGGAHPSRLPGMWFHQTRLSHVSSYKFPSAVPGLCIQGPRCARLGGRPGWVSENESEHNMTEVGESQRNHCFIIELHN